MERMKREIKIEDRRWTLKTYKKCWVGEEAVKWMREKVEGVDSEEEAVKLGKLMQSYGLVAHVFHDQPFKNGFFFYRFQPRVIHSGFLMYKERSSRPFQLLWFVLKEDSILSFQNLEEEKPLFSISLSNFSLSSSYSPPQQLQLVASQHQQSLLLELQQKHQQHHLQQHFPFSPFFLPLFHFSIFTEKEVHFFASHTQSQRDDWVHCLSPLNPLLNTENHIIEQIELKLTAEEYFHSTFDRPTSI